jgi:hypothetical protein
MPISITSTSPGRIISSQYNPGLTPGVSASQFATSAAGYFAQRYGPRIVGAAQNRLDTAINTFANRVSGSDSGNNNSDNSDDNNGNGNNNGVGGLPPRGGRRARSRGRRGFVGGAPNIEGVPKLELDSGIESGTVLNPLQPTTEIFTPLYILCGTFFPTDESQIDSSTSQLLNSDLFYKYSVLIQSEVNYSLAKYFTEKNFYKHFEVLSEALQLYYMVDSILAYTSYTPNNNLGMTRLRMCISPDVANSHLKLREFLSGIPIPPNLLSVIRHMYQNYTFSDVAGAPVIRLSLHDYLCTSEYDGTLGLDADIYGEVFKNLIDNSATSSTIAKIRSNWIGPLPPSSYEALYDPQFCTFWHNSNCAFEDYGSNAIKHTISANSDDETMYYGIFGNRLDGLIYGMCSVMMENNIIEKGLWTPFSDFGSRNSINSSLLHFSNDGVIRPVTEASVRIGSMMHSAPYSEVTADKNLVWKVVPCTYAGANIPQLHSLTNVTQAITRSINFIFQL